MWGESWGSMVWSGSATLVPALGSEGLAILIGLMFLSTVMTARIRLRRKADRSSAERLP